MDITKLNKDKLPKHIAVIMDGNGRWAKKRALARINGHRTGMEAVRRVVKICNDIGIEVLTLYAFSTENWRRPRAEVRALMSLLKRYIRAEIAELHSNNIRVQAIEEGMTTLKQDGIEKVFAGHVDFKEVRKVCIK